MNHSPIQWTIEYDNDTGPGDDAFNEWWNVTDGRWRTFRCNSEDDAAFLIRAVNSHEALLAALKQTLDATLNESNGRHSPWLDSIVTEARAAIEAAEGVKP